MEFHSSIEKTILLVFTKSKPKLRSVSSEGFCKKNCISFEHDQKLLIPWFKNNLLRLNIHKCVVIVYAYKTPSWAQNITLATDQGIIIGCLLYTSPSPRDRTRSRMPSSA